MKKVIAIAFSDLHLNDWSKFNTENSRTMNGFSVLHRIAKVCDRYKCPALFCGDLFHKAEVMTQELRNITDRELGNLPSTFRCYAINGNHDLYQVNSPTNRKEGWVHILSRQFPWLTILDFRTVEFPKLGFNVHGVPYIDHNQGLGEYLKTVKTDILLLHTDYPGATDTDGRIIDSAENLNINMFKQFKLVLIGHIHKHQRLGKKIYMVGAPQQQRRTDRNCEMGYMKIYEDFTCSFVHLDGYPKFIDVESQEDVKDDGNYYTVVPKTSREVKQTEHKITKQLSKKKLARLYMKQKGDTNKSRRKLLTKVLIKSEQC